MYFLKNSKFAGLIAAAAFCIVSAQAQIAARDAMEQPSVIFYDDVSQIGASFSPAQIIPGECQTLPGNWLGRAESLDIGPGYTCNFYIYAGCEGVGQQLSGTVNGLSGSTTPPLYNNIESFSCNRQVA